MSRLLQRLFGRLPIGWLQLTHNRTRFAAALAGVAFANVLVFVQLGIMNSMGAATLRPYTFFQPDVMISAGDANSLTDGGNVARQWLLQAMADPDVTDGMGLFIANVPWDRGDKDISLTTFGIDPVKPALPRPRDRHRPNAVASAGRSDPGSTCARAGKKEAAGSAGRPCPSKHKAAR